MRFFTHIKETFSFDYRSLALYRFLLGLIVVADVIYRLPDVVNFYTDVGLIPRSIFVSEMSMPWSFSLHLANGSSAFAFFMFGLHLIFGVMIVVGIKTHWAMIGAFLMTVSVHNRNWLVNNGGDDILRALLFISIFLPLNRCFSVDSALRTNKSAERKNHFSTWGLVFFFQVFAIYFVSFILKDHPIWRKEFSAIFFSSRLDIFATPFGVWLRDFSTFLKLSTVFTIYTEYWGPLLLIFSFLFARFWWGVRLFVITLFISLHFGIILTMWIGVFPYLCIVMWLMFIPSSFWDKINSHFQRSHPGGPTLFFDKECRFCEKAVLLVREFCCLSQVTILEAQSDSRVERSMKKENSWVVKDSKGKEYYHFSAMLEVLKHSPVFRFLVPLLSKKFLAAPLNASYKWMASHRGLLSKLSQFFEFHPEKTKISWLVWIYHIAGAFIFVTLLMWNLTTIKKWNVRAPFFQDVTRWIHLYQEWNMFAPYPKMDNIWVEIPAVLGDGSEIELLTGDRDIFEVKDKKFPHIIPNEHWRKFYLNLSEKTDYARYYGGYLCRSWNDRNIQLVKDVSLRTFEIIVYSQGNLPDGQKGGINRKLSWKHWCFDEDYKKDNKAASEK
jgi:hypothetical protein